MQVASMTSMIQHTYDSVFLRAGAFDSVEGCHRCWQRQPAPCRFYSRMQAEAGMGHETISATLANLQGQSASGKHIAVVKKYVGKMARSGREDEAKLMVSRFHAKACAGANSPGPAKYSPERALASEAQSSYRHQGGFSFGKAERPLAKQGLAKITF